MKMTMPLFLGKAVDEDGFFFLGHKDGVNAFIKYSTTRDSVFWCYSTSLPDFLDSSEVPESVLNKVVNFVGGPSEITTLVVSLKKAKRVSANPSQQEVHGETHVQSGISRQQPTQEQSERKTASSTTSGTGERRSEKSRVSWSQERSSENLPVQGTEEGRSKGEEGTGGGFETNPSDGDRDFRAVAGGGRSRIGPDLTSDESDARRVLGTRVLGSGGAGEPEVHERSPDGGPSDNRSDGDDGPGIKKRRKRRTKAEMEEARRLASVTN